MWTIAALKVVMQKPFCVFFFRWSPRKESSKKVDYFLHHHKILKKTIYQALLESTFILRKRKICQVRRRCWIYIFELLSSTMLNRSLELNVNFSAVKIEYMTGFCSQAVSVVLPTSNFF